MLTAAFSLLLNKCKRVEVVEKCTVDTLIIHTVDTIKDYYPKYITKRVVDTIYIETNNKAYVPLDVVQKHYSTNNVFDLWISGVEPLHLDSINVYSKTEYKTINKEIVREVYPLKWKLYVGGGFKAISETFIPEMNISLASPKKWLITANIGIYEGDMVYGGSVSYRIK